MDSTARTRVGRWLIVAALVAVGCGDGSVVPGEPDDPATVRGRIGGGGDSGSAAGAAGTAGAGAGGSIGGTAGASGQGGSGPTTCPAYQALCNGSCIDVTTTAHCGSCNNVCGSGQACTSGACAGGPSGAGGSTGSIAVCDPATGYQITSDACYDASGQLQHHAGLECNMCGSLLGPGQFCVNRNGALCVRLCSDCH